MHSFDKHLTTVQVADGSISNNGIHKRDASFDISRGIGILLVLIWHSNCLHIFPYLINMCFLPLFFVITGCVSNIPPEDSKELLRSLGRRCRRLLVPYIGYSLLLLLIYIVRVNVSDLSFNKHYITGLFYARYWIRESGPQLMSMDEICNAQLWFLPCMLLTSLSFSVINRYVKNELHLLLIILALLVSSILFGMLPVLLPCSIDTVPICLLFCFFGKAIIKHRVLSDKPSVKTVMLMIGIAIVYCVAARINRSDVNLSLRNYGKYGFISILLYLFAGCLGSFVILQFSRLIRHYKIGKALSWLGKNTLPLLAFHVILNVLFASLFSSFFYQKSILQNYAYEWCRVFFSLLVIIPIKLLYDRVVHKSALLETIRKKLYNY